MAEPAHRALSQLVPLSYVRRELGEEAAGAWLEGEPARVVRTQQIIGIW